MSMDLQDKVVLVTGGSRGIGAAIVRAMVEQGARVMLTYHNRADAAADVMNTCAKDQVASVAMDVANRKDVEHAFEVLHQTWGQLDVLVNNAGYLKQTPFQDITDDEWHQTIDTNLQGVFLCSQIAGRIFERQNRGGAVVNISSVGGQMGGTKAPHYAASKAGVISMTKSTAKLFAPFGVRVNAIAPGFIKTDMYDHIVAQNDVQAILASIPLARVGLPEDVAHAAVFLASDKASYITGHVLNVNGGQYLGSGS